MTNKILIRLKPFDRLEIPNLEISSPSHCNFTFFRCYEVEKTETATSMLVTDVEDKKMLVKILRSLVGLAIFVTKNVNPLP